MPVGRFVYRILRPFLVDPGRPGLFSVQNISGRPELRRAHGKAVRARSGTYARARMLGTYASLVVVLAGATATGQAALAVCGRRRWSGIAPAVGLAALCALAWGTVRLPGEGTTAAIACGLAAAVAAVFLRGRVEGTDEALRRAAPVALGAVALASVPFIVEGRFGILGTGLNPDMSQHLFAVDRLAAGGSERLVDDGYPLGPHSIVVALSALGPSTVAGLRRADRGDRRRRVPGGLGAARPRARRGGGSCGALLRRASPTWSRLPTCRARSRRRWRRCSSSRSPSGWASSRGSGR